MTTLKQPWMVRLISCLGGGFVLALMYGPQEGTINADFGIAFFQALGLKKGINPAFQFPWRGVLFLSIGLVLFVLISFWRFVVPYLRSPGMRPLLMGLIGVIIAQTVMNWDDAILHLPNHNNSRFFTAKDVVDGSPSLSGLTANFFDWLSWVLLVATVVACAVAIVLPKLRWLGYLTLACGVAGAVIAYNSHHDLVNASTQSNLGPDHSLGVYVDVASFLLMGFAGITASWARSTVADTREFLTRITTWRPGLPLVAIGVVLGLFAYANDCWYAPLSRNADLGTTHDLFSGTGISPVGLQYLDWLGWTLFAAGAVVTGAATYLGNKVLAWLSVLAGVTGIVLTFVTLHSMTFLGFHASPNDGQPWGNLGAGGFSAFIVYALFAAAAVQVLLSGERTTVSARDWAKDLPVSAMVMKVRRSAQARPRCRASPIRPGTGRHQSHRPAWHSTLAI